MFVCAALAATAFVATPAAAQATETTATASAAAAPVGGRVEALIGYDRINIDLGDGFDANDSGVLFGAGLGYDFAVGNGVSAGVDAEITESTISEEAEGAEASIGRDLYFGGRVSFAVSPSANLYVKAGYTNVRAKAEYEGESESANADGLRIGGGAQFAVGGKAYVGGECRYSNYEADVTRHQVALTLGTRF